MACTFENVRCVNCKQKKKKVSKALLTCNHPICHNCIDNILRQKFGDDLSIISIDKRRLYDEQCDKECGKMVLGTDESDGIIYCPKCNDSYSIFCAIFRDHGIPLKINGIVEFEHEGKIIKHHLCTTLDLIHLMPKDTQATYLSNYDYKGVDEFDPKNIKEISNYDVNCGEYHVIKDSKSYMICDKSKCEACKGNGEHLQFDEYLNLLM